MAKKTTKNNFDIKQLIDNSGSYKNLVYGAITVVVLGIIVFLGVRTLSENKGDINDGAVTINEEEDVNEYTVASGDTLWSISEKVYGTGFNWKAIADANNITDGNDVKEGTKLTIPVLTPTAGESMVSITAEPSKAMEEKVSPTVKPTDAPKVTEKVSPTVAQKVSPTPSISDPGTKPTANDKEYTVKSGDSLWKIAVAQYGDGYKWTEIAKANKLVHPNVIHTGNKLVIPR